MEKGVPVPDHTETREVGQVAGAYTPGPWAWYRREVAGVEEGTELRSPHGQVLCIDLPEFIAVEDKRLIASAPDLLDVVRMTADCFNEQTRLGKQAREVIALAEGR